MTPDVASPLAAYKLPLQKGASPMKGSPYKLPQVHSAGSSPAPAHQGSPAGYRLPTAVQAPSQDTTGSSPAPAHQGSPAGYRLPTAVQAPSPDTMSLRSSQLSDDATSRAASSQHGSEESSNASVAEANHCSDTAAVCTPDRHPRLLDAAGAAEALRLRRQVMVTASYRSRVAPTERTLSEGGHGVVVKTYELEEGHIADVIWDCGKVLQGYCIGYRGIYDLEYAPTRSPKKNPTLGAGRKLDLSPRPEAQNKVARSDHIQGDIKVHVGYMGTAPKIEYHQPKAIWSGGGPIDYAKK